MRLQVKSVINPISILVQFYIVCLQNLVLMIFNVVQKCPKQAAFDLQLTYLQPLLNCSSLPLRVISKSIVAFLSDYEWYMDNSCISTPFLTSDEVKFFADSFASFINSGYILTDDRTITFSVEELLFSFQKISLLPWEESYCALPCLLDALLALSSYDDKTIATSALEVLWNISMEPTVGLAILCHKNVVCTLQKMSVFNVALADLARNILWILGYGNAEGECHIALIIVINGFTAHLLYIFLQISLDALSMQLLATNLASIQKLFHGVITYHIWLLQCIP